MKEATSELNMVVVVLIAVGVMAAFFYSVIWPSMKENTATSLNCKNAICPPENKMPDETGRVACYIMEGTNKTPTKCIYKGLEKE